MYYSRQRTLSLFSWTCPFQASSKSGPVLRKYEPMVSYVGKPGDPVYATCIYSPPQEDSPTLPECLKQSFLPVHNENKTHYIFAAYV